MTKAQLEALSEFRYSLRRFLRFSEDAAREAGVTPLHYQLMLHIAGMPGREYASVSELAERLQSQHHGVVALVSRCEQSGLVQRRPGREDRRQVEVHLLPKGRACLDRLAALHREQLAFLAEATAAAAAQKP